MSAMHPTYRQNFTCPYNKGLMRKLAVNNKLKIKEYACIPFPAALILGEMGYGRC